MRHLYASEIELFEYGGLPTILEDISLVRDEGHLASRNVSLKYNKTLGVAVLHWKNPYHPYN